MNATVKDDAAIVIYRVHILLKIFKNLTLIFRNAKFIYYFEQLKILFTVKNLIIKLVSDLKLSWYRTYINKLQKLKYNIYFANKL